MTAHVDAVGGRRVPAALRWAWPAEGLDQLLLAAACPDEARARSAVHAWLATHDIDTVEYRDHRLLATIVDRCTTGLADLAELPAGPRLAGLQRHLWTRSRMAIAQAATALRNLVDAGIPVMLLKGAARIAADPGSARSRLAHDVDALVPPERFADAVDGLHAAGWTASSGESQLCLRARAPEIRAMNFFRDRFGDVDLHQWAYGVGRLQAGLECALWQHARPAEFFGVSVLVPSDTDRAALAIVNSGLDAHAHSDWLVDCARLATPRVDWGRLLDTLRAARAVLPAQVAFSYLARHVGIAVPGKFLDELLADPAGGPVRRGLALLQTKPRANWSPWTAVARGVAKHVCRAAAVRPPRCGTTLKGVFRRRGRAAAIGATATRHRLDGLAGVSGPTRVRIDVGVQLPGLSRRIEFEVHAAGRHVARLRARSVRRREGPWLIRFDGAIDLPADGTAAWLEARPAKRLRGGADDAEIRRYATLPCSILAVHGRPRPGRAR